MGSFWLLWGIFAAMNAWAASTLDKTIIALATPPGIGAIGVIRVSGAAAFQTVASVFHGRDLLEQPSHTVHLGTIREGGQVLDEVLVTLFRSPRSYTGEDVIEISTHGSPFIQQKIIELLISKGASPAGPGEFTLRAFLNKKLDLPQAEAVADMIAADSELALQTAMSQMRGRFSADIQDLRTQLIHFASLIELELDFAEEDVEFADRSQLINLVQQILVEVEKLLGSFRYGNVIRNGVPTVIAGRPNAGKSTLLNALLNEDRAIVSDIPGTTRDTIEETIQVGGIQFRFIDTAGIREAASTIEHMGIARTYEKISQASLVIYLFDASLVTPEMLAADLADIRGQAGDKRLLVVGNKTDKIDEAARKTFEASGNMIWVSAANRSIDHLLSALKDMVMETRGAAGDVMITNARHFAVLSDTRIYLQSVLADIDRKTSGDLLAFNIRKALQSLGEISGEITTDDLLGNIFSKFCIGK